MIITLRLQADEVAALEKICQSKVRGDLNRSEMLRLLIRREYQRRFGGGGGVGGHEYSTECRQGRPAANRNTLISEVESSCVE